MHKSNNLRFSRNSKGYIYAVFYCSDARADVSIGKQVSKELWDNKEKEPLPKGIRQRINRLENMVTTFVESKGREDSPILKDELTEVINKELGRVEKAKKDNLQSYFSTYRGEVANGNIDNKGKPYSASTLRHIDALKTILEESPIGKIKLHKFSYSHFTALKQSMLADKLSQNTMNVYCITFIKFFKRTRKLKWHTNSWFLDEETTIGKEDIDTHIYFTEAEIDKLYKTEVKDLWEQKVRDLFVFGCNIGLRHSDLSRLQNATVKGGVLHIMAKKVGKTVHIPLNATAREIWDKYGGVMPVRGNANFNTNIRDLCKAAGFTELCLYVRTEGGVKKEYHLPKYKLAGTHSMRRSFATNAYLAGVPITAIMKVTGHSTEESFRKYLRISNQENANELKKHAFFK